MGGSGGRPKGKIERRDWVVVVFDVESVLEEIWLDERKEETGLVCTFYKEFDVRRSRI